MAEIVLAVVAALGAATGIYTWATRAIVRSELEPIRRDLGRKGEDIAVLKVAVFNHWRHGRRPTEARVRKELGYEPR